jgi:hypothetical protein
MLDGRTQFKLSVAIGQITRGTSFVVVYQDDISILSQDLNILWCTVYRWVLTVPPLHWRVGVQRVFQILHVAVGVDCGIALRRKHCYMMIMIFNSVL